MEHNISIGTSLFKSVSIEISKTQKITYERSSRLLRRYKPCYLCKKNQVCVKDKAEGYPTIIRENICYECALKNKVIPQLNYKLN